MRFKRPIYRILFYTAWVLLIGGIVTLLVAANSKSKARTCTGVMVSVNNGGDRIYVEKEDVLKSIEKTSHGSIVNKHTGDINLSKLEKGLEANPWIRDAELYFDTKDVLHVSVQERVPVARVFTTLGNSFYLDSTGAQMPLLESYSAKLPVVTGFTAAKRLHAADSALLRETKEVVQTIGSNAFWNAQIGQIDITPEHKFELVPLLGSHTIRLGNGTNVAEKLGRLMVFYKQVLPKAGFAKYSALDLQFDGQVVAVKRGPTSPVDSIQLQKNIQQLMERKAAEQEPDDDEQPVGETAQTGSGDVEEPTNASDTAVASVAVEKPKATTPSATVVAKPNLVKTTVQKSLGANAGRQQTKPAQKSSAEKKAAPKPKAVMQKKAANEY